LFCKITSLGTIIVSRRNNHSNSILMWVNFSVTFDIKSLLPICYCKQCRYIDDIYCIYLQIGPAIKVKQYIYFKITYLLFDPVMYLYCLYNVPSSRWINHRDTGRVENSIFLKVSTGMHIIYIYSVNGHSSSDIFVISFIIDSFTFVGNLSRRYSHYYIRKQTVARTSTVCSPSILKAGTYTFLWSLLAACPDRRGIT